MNINLITKNNDNYSDNKSDSQSLRDYTKMQLKAKMIAIPKIKSTYLDGEIFEIHTLETLAKISNINFSFRKAVVKTIIKLNNALQKKCENRKRKNYYEFFKEIGKKLELDHLKAEKIFYFSKYSADIEIDYELHNAIQQGNAISIRELLFNKEKIINSYIYINNDISGPETKSDSKSGYFSTPFQLLIDKLIREKDDDKSEQYLYILNQMIHLKVNPNLPQLLYDGINVKEINLLYDAMMLDRINLFNLLRAVKAEIDCYRPASSYTQGNWNEVLLDQGKWKFLIQCIERNLIDFNQFIKDRKILFFTNKNEDTLLDLAFDLDAEKFFRKCLSSCASIEMDEKATKWEMLIACIENNLIDFDRFISSHRNFLSFTDLQNGDSLLEKIVEFGAEKTFKKNFNIDKIDLPTTKKAALLIKCVEYDLIDFNQFLAVYPDLLSFFTKKETLIHMAIKLKAEKVVQHCLLHSTEVIKLLNKDKCTPIEVAIDKYIEKAVTALAPPTKGKNGNYHTKVFEKLRKNMNSLKNIIKCLTQHNAICRTKKIIDSLTDAVDEKNPALIEALIELDVCFEGRWTTMKELLNAIEQGLI